MEFGGISNVHPWPNVRDMKKLSWDTATEVKFGRRQIDPESVRAECSKTVALPQVKPRSTAIERLFDAYEEPPPL